MTATARIARTELPLPIARNEAQGWGGELEAVDALWTAYMALNAVGCRGNGIESSLAWQNGLQSPMSLTAKAAKAALARIPGINARQATIIWDAMCDGGSSAQYCYDLWRRGDI